MIVEELVAKIGLDFTGAANAAKAVTSVNSIKGAMLGVSGVVLALNASLQAITLHTAEEVLELEHFGEAVGVSVPTLQALGVAAGRVGGSIEDVQTGLRFLANNSVAAADGSENLQASFARLGVKVTDAHGKIRTVEALLPDVAAGFEKIEDPSRRVSLAIDLFGRGGLNVLKALQQTGGDLEGFTNGLKASGRVMDEAVIKRFAEVAKAVKSLGGKFKGLKNLLAINFLPYTEKTITSLTKAISKATPYFASFAEHLSGLVGGSMELVGKAATGLVGMLAKLPTWLLAVAGAGAALAAVMFLPGVAILTLSFLIAAIGEDINRFLNGQSSLLGKVTSGWKQFNANLLEVADTATGLVGVLARLATITGGFGRIGVGVLGGDVREAANGARQILGLKDITNAQFNRDAFQNGAQQGQLPSSPLMYPGAFATSPLSNAAQGYLGREQAPAAKGPTNVTNNITVTGTAGMNETDLAKKVAEEVSRSMEFTIEEVRSSVGVR